jgi:prefoldin subunit 5|tara:strand:+ start:60 stop:287 length:228 start_codon:yes stop_codon:yes gene_type:complete
MSSKYTKVEGQPHIVKDVGRGTFINTNTDEINSARRRKVHQLEKNQETTKIKNDIETLKDEMLDIKSLLKQILEK